MTITAPTRPADPSEGNATASTTAAPTATATAVPYDLIASLGEPDGVAATQTLPADALGDDFDTVQRRMRAWLRQWQPVTVPAFEVVRDAFPASERRSSLRAAETRADGAVRVSASLYDPPTSSGELLMWSRNWVSVVSLPRVTEPGRLHYRFSVGSRLVLDGQAGTSLVSTSVNFGIVADTATASPFDAPGFTTPIARPLVGVRCAEDADAHHVEEFEGSIEVETGDAPAMAFVLGTDVVFRDGWARIHEGSSSWVGPAGAGPSGTVETRFTPAPLLAMFGEHA